MFRVGQKVVCVNALGTRGLVVGKEYEVSYVHHDHCIAVGFDPRPLDYHIAYSSGRFRPIVERKTDISIFTEMLNPTRKHEVAT